MHQVALVKLDSPQVCHALLELEYRAGTAAYVFQHNVLTLLKELKDAVNAVLWCTDTVEHKALEDQVFLVRFEEHREFVNVHHSCSLLSDD